LWSLEETNTFIPIRARLGKSIGGQPSLGYKWENKALVINEAEAPLRKLVYELFLKYQRQATTANALNKLGYRTQNGNLFSRTGIYNLLRDPMAKGERRAAYTTRTGRNRQWTMKPKEEWIILPCPAIVTEEVWNQCNHLLDEQERRTKRPGPKAVHLLSGLVRCICGKTMYVFHRSMVYTCKGCRNRIAMNDIDEIYQAHLKGYLSNINASPHLEQSDRDLSEKKELLETTTKERNKLAKTMDTIIQLRVEGELTKERFKAQYDPLELRLSQLDAQLPELEAEIDVRTMYLRSSETIVQEAWNLSEQWHLMPFEQRRGIVEIITTEIIIDKQDITIRLAYIPPPSLNEGKSVRHPLVAIHAPHKTKSPSPQLYPHWSKLPASTQNVFSFQLNI
jgi:site-specific DNA recombinase